MRHVYNVISTLHLTFREKKKRHANTEPVRDTVLVHTNKTMFCQLFSLSVTISYFLFLF